MLITSNKTVINGPTNGGYWATFHDKKKWPSAKKHTHLSNLGIPIEAGIPDGYEEYHIRDAEECHIKIDENNIMLFHSIDLGGLDICISHYLILIYEPMKFFADANRYTSEFHNVLKGKAQYRSKGFDWRRIKECQYNLIYLDEVKNEVRFTGLFLLLTSRSIRN